MKEKKIQKTKKNDENESEFYGTAIVGTKGQIVIPQDARLKYNLNTGDKVIIFGGKEGVLALVKADKLKDLFSSLSKEISNLL